MNAMKTPFYFSILLWYHTLETPNNFFRSTPLLQYTLLSIIKPSISIFSLCSWSTNKTLMALPTPTYESSSLPNLNISQLVILRLQKHKYLTWKPLFIPIFKKYHLTDHIDSTFSCPAEFNINTTNDGIITTVDNTSYKQWQDDNQSLLI